MIKTKLQDCTGRVWASNTGAWLLERFLNTGSDECGAVHANCSGSQKNEKTLAKRIKGEYTVFVNQSSRIFSQKWPKLEFRVRVRVKVPARVFYALQGISSLRTRVEEIFRSTFTKPVPQPESRTACGFRQTMELPPQAELAPRFTQTTFWPELSTQQPAATNLRATATLRKPKQQQINGADRAFAQGETRHQNIWRRLRHRIGTCDSTCHRCKHKWAVIELTPHTDNKRIRAFRAYA